MDNLYARVLSYKQFIFHFSFIHSVKHCSNNIIMFDHTEACPFPDAPRYLVDFSGNIYDTKKRRVVSAYPGVRPHHITGLDYMRISLMIDKSKQKSFQIHRIVGITFIDNPEDLPEVDHIKSKEITNNHVSNLRWATKPQQRRNSTVYRQRKHCIRFRGVELKSSGRYRARIRFNGQNKHIGTYDTQEAAARAYNTALREIDPVFGTFNDVWEQREQRDDEEDSI